MKSFDADANQIQCLDKYILTVTVTEKKNEQNNLMVEAKLDDDCEFHGDGFEERRTKGNLDEASFPPNLSMDDLLAYVMANQTFLCWKLDLFKNKYPFKMVSSYLVDNLEENGCELVDDQRQ